MISNPIPAFIEMTRETGKWLDCGVHGDWAWEQDGHGNCWHIWKCSKCEYKTEHRSNYCPNCGAEMRGDKNE